MLRRETGKRRRHPSRCKVTSGHKHSFRVQTAITVRDLLARGADRLAHGIERWRLTRIREMSIHGRSHGQIKGVVHSWLRVEQRGEVRAEPILEVAFLLQPALEQRLDALLRFGPGQRGRKRVTTVEEPVDGW
jgi:hypothetical protein